MRRMTARASGRERPVHHRFFINGGELRVAGEALQVGVGCQEFRARACVRQMASQTTRTFDGGRVTRTAAQAGLRMTFETESGSLGSDEKALFSAMRVMTVGAVRSGSHGSMDMRILIFAIVAPVAGFLRHVGPDRFRIQPFQMTGFDLMTGVARTQRNRMMRVLVIKLVGMAGRAFVFRSHGDGHLLANQSRRTLLVTGRAARNIQRAGAGFVLMATQAGLRVGLRTRSRFNVVNHVAGAPARTVWIHSGQVGTFLSRRILCHPGAGNGKDRDQREKDYPT